MIFECSLAYNWKAENNKNNSISQNSKQKFHLIKCEITEFNDEFNSSRLNIQIQTQTRRKTKIDFTVKICKIFKILGRKIHLFRCEMTEESEE